MANVATFRNSKLSKFLFSLGVITSLYWFAGVVGAYNSDAGSAVFEYLWIFMVLLLLLLPLVSLLFVVRERTSFRSLNLLTLIISLGTIVLLMILS